MPGPGRNRHETATAFIARAPRRRAASFNPIEASQLTVASPPTVIIRPTRSALDLDLVALYRSWELVYFLTWRDVKVRYKQTVIGVGWAVLQPLITMLIFTALFNKVAGISSEGLPYPLFAFAGLLPWTYFSQAVSRGGTSLVNNAGLVTKIYFPRLAIPLSAVVAPLVDFAATCALLLAMMAYYRVVPGWGLIALPLFLFMSVATALAVSLWLSALCVKYRDVGVIIPFLVQIWMYASPVAYPISVVPERWRLLYGLNPMAGVIEGFRWSLLGTDSPDFTVMGVSMLMVVGLLISGAIYFNRTEQTFADVV
jgi:lipopolysaccharide transport system permease protein